MTLQIIYKFLPKKNSLHLYYSIRELRRESQFSLSQLKTPFTLWRCIRRCLLLRGYLRAHDGSEDRFQNQVGGINGNGDLRGVVNYRRITEVPARFLQIFRVEVGDASSFLSPDTTDACLELLIITAY